MPSLDTIRCTNVVNWVDIYQNELTRQDIFQKFDIDICNNTINKHLLASNNTQNIKIDEILLDHMGYLGEFRHKNYNFRQLLKSNSHIQYSEVADENDFRKMYVVLNGQSPNQHQSHTFELRRDQNYWVVNVNL